MNIGIDIDGVLNDCRKWESEHATTYFKSKGIEVVDPTGYDICEMFGVSFEEEEMFWHKYVFDYAKDVEVREGASEVMHKLKADGNNLVIITARSFADENNSRGRRMQKEIINWLAKNNIEYNKIIYSGHDKVPSVIENKIDVMIEDSPRNVTIISKIIPVICFDTIYNKDISGKNIYRSSSWYDILKILKNFNQK